MRMAFGLVSLLVTMGIIALLFSMHTQQVATSGIQARDVAEQIAGVESSGLGGRASQHIVLADRSINGRLQSIVVNSITPGSSMQTYFGLQNGDQILTVGPQTVRDIGDAEMAKALIQESYQRQWPLVVMRNNVRLELPAQKNAMSPVATPAPAAPVAQRPVAGQQPAPVQPGQTPPAAPAQPAQPAKQPPKQDSGNPLYRQLDAIQNYGK